MKNQLYQEYLAIIEERYALSYYSFIDLLQCELDCGFIRVPGWESRTGLEEFIDIPTDIVTG